MGYDCRIYVVRKMRNGLIHEHNKIWAETIAMFELCKMDYDGAYHALLKTATPTNSYIYTDDGNTELLTDCYGEELKEMTLAEVVSALMADEATGHYRRLPPVIAFLESLQAANESEWGGELRILHYGH